MKTLKVGIASYEDMKARTLAIARGELRPKPSDPKVWFTSPESFARLLSNRNRALLAQIADTQPESLHELATTTGRMPSNLSRTLRTMERYGLVQLHKGVRGKVRPEVTYRDVQLEMPLMTKRDIHVVPHGQGWATRKEGAQRVGHTAGTQREAVELARTQAKRERVEVVIHRRSGEIRNSNSYGNDPNPPKDKVR